MIPSAPTDAAMPFSRIVHVVDGDRAVCRSLSRLLRSAGFQPACYKSPFKFLDIAPELTVECVLLDVRLGSISGLEVQARLSQIGVSLPVIVLTWHGDIRTAVEFVEKPVDVGHLLVAIEPADKAPGKRTADAVAAAKLIVASTASSKPSGLPCLPANNCAGRASGRRRNGIRLRNLLPPAEAEDWSMP